MANIGQVDLAGRQFDLCDLQNEPARHVDWFERAKRGVGHGLCLCVDGGRRLQLRVRDGVYHFAGWPNDGASHHPGCQFHKTPPDMTGASGYTEGAIKEREDGSIDIRADITLRVRTEERNPVGTRSAGSSGKSRSSVRLLGFMHSLWERSRLNQWRPGWKRPWSRCQWELCNLEGRINRQRFEDILYVVPAFDAGQKDQIADRFDKFRANLGVHGVYRARGIVIGEVKELAKSEYGHRLDLRHHAQPFFASDSLVERVRISSGQVLSHISDAGARVLAILVVELSRKGFMTIVDMAIMLTSRNYIPVESSFELRMSDALTAAGRAFIKPLKYDGVADEFPDFRLIDADPEVLVEVYGMCGNPDYDRRKLEKQASYRTKGIRVIEWDTREPIPSMEK